ncbi:DUF3667 domain-containing protein [Luteimonas yindakuii]|uniref:DUF3667 domain-containing protein n=1 Tax=Luteimonas yindakuii TaxID=2565782 RepID=UPI001AA0352E|nr:DUF3667 domain-containing protein [Luteimonas yindakuii]
MSNAATERHAPACENCGTWLQGGYCHLCGQSAHNPTRHFGHAVEEIFESFWHLDGRVFRTLRDLFVPGRVANAYLAGHRVRYIAPLRLFVVLTALTFFTAKMVMTPVISDDSDPLPQDAATLAETAGAAAPAASAPPRRLPEGLEESFAALDTVRAVEREREHLLRDLARDDAPRALGFVFDEARRRIDATADARIRALGGEPGSRDEPATLPAQPPAADAGADAGASVDTDTDASADAATSTPGETGPGEVSTGNAFVDRTMGNWQRLTQDPRAIAQFLFGAAPATLFVLVPLFAVLLRVAYFFTRRPYLEHVVIALYSHAWLMLALLLVFCASALGDWAGTRVPAIASVLSWLVVALVCAMPLYLLWMQRRVYRQAWWLTLLKYAVIGYVYTMLFGTVAVGVIGFSLFTM